MSEKTLIRWGGTSILIASVLLAVAGILVAIVPDGGLSNPLPSVLYYAGLAICSLAITAAYLPQSHSAGRLGFAGYVLASLGAVLYASPLIALIAGTSGVQTWHDVWGFAMGNVLMVGPAAFFIGSICLGAATRRAGIYPRWSGSLLIAGAGIWMVAFFTSLPFTLTMAVVIFSTGFAGLGWTLLADRTVAKLQTQPGV